MSANGQPVANGGPKEPTERTPLTPPRPSTVDASQEAVLEAHSNGLIKHSPDGTSNGTSNGIPNGINHSKPSASGSPEIHTTANQSLSTARTILCTLALGLLIFLQATNISMLTTTQTSIAADLDAYDKVSWFTSSYLIAMSALSPLNGKLAAVFSPRVCIFVSAIVLAAGGVLSSLAQGFEGFVVGRAATGIGASGVFTVSIIIVLELTGSKRRGLAIGLLNSGYTVGVAVGATAAGALLPVIGWRALFWTQAPIALLGGTVLLFAIPRDFTAGAKDKSGHGILKRLAGLDYLGATTLTASLVLLLYALSSPKPIPVLPIILSGIVLITFILNETYLASDPIIPITLLRSRPLLLTCLATTGYMLARWLVLFYTPTYALAVRGWSPSSSGAILIPTNFGFALGGLTVGWLHITRKGSFYTATLIVYALFPVTLVGLSLLVTEDSSAVAFVLVVGLCGAVTGAALNYSLAHLLHLTPKSTHYIATSLLATFRGFAGSFGSAIGGGIFTRRLAASLTEGFANAGLEHEEGLVRRLLGAPALVGELRGVEREVAVRGYEDALRTLFLAGAGLAGVMVLVQAGTGWKNAEDEEGKDVLVEEEEALLGRAEGQEENESRGSRV
ncbi:hypothetical protein LTR12_006130 [Friedmanniomyces endolithicus]|nr:hypothetical protein LTR74_001980 [Friedmanniomyces endolithicus]KAK1819429.1 hypothetical protein LTR12_006130 [Friedmanniomyces endolithicus]